MCIADQAIELLMTGPKTSRQLQDAIGCTKQGIYHAMLRLKEAGDVTVEVIRNGQIKSAVWTYVESDIDFTPNAVYEGPSFTHFLQSLWREPLGVQHDACTA